MLVRCYHCQAGSWVNWLKTRNTGGRAHGGNKNTFDAVMCKGNPCGPVEVSIGCRGWSKAYKN